MYGALPILGHGMEVLLTPVFEMFYAIGSYFMVQLDLIDPHFLQKKICLSLSHLVPWILSPNCII